MKKADTLWTVDGSFQFTRQTCGALLRLSFYRAKTKQNTVRKFFATTGEASISADTTIILSDPKLQDIYQEFTKRYQPTATIKSNLGQLYFAQHEITREEKAALNKLTEAASDLQFAGVKRFVKENKDNLVGGYVLANYLYNLPDIEQTDSLYRLFSPQLIQTSYPLHEFRKELDIKMSLLPGHVPPELSGIDIRGKAFTVASLKGKYVLLDFWGSWCLPCLSGLPKMKAAYEKYKDRIAFVSIACHDKEIKWRAMVTKQNMTWTQLLDDKKDRIARQYYVETFPTKILIGPDGKVIQVFKGEGNDFYDQLDKVLQK
ncbi:TlpA family protein disulfide reductase [Mucilaginibacter mali]|uniref:TlpA family protein disulfide reductase n=1 Tax=Mucilaginibacter mali TaxID=2740462 RepID=A0A7D4Q7B4_9SPHI|nr:TlpA disulfide reductase family protein [Mucilaginibacter mali]QKJ32847.1 TlpA family protein disulfide reductase [Mucilaginibacter mali]